MLSPLLLLLLLLQDWNALYRSAGIKSFMAVPIGGAGEVLGLLTIAKHEAGAFNDEWCVQRILSRLLHFASADG